MARHSDSPVSDSPVDTLRQLEAFLAVKQIFRAIASNRRFLLKVVCGGRYHFISAMEREFRGMAVQPNVFDSMWAYFVHHAGPGNLKEELGLLLEQQAIEQASKAIDVDQLVDDIRRVDDGAPMGLDGRVH